MGTACGGSRECSLSCFILPCSNFNFSCSMYVALANLEFGTFTLRPYRVILRNVSPSRVGCDVRLDRSVSSRTRRSRLCVLFLFLLIIFGVDY